MKVPLPDRRPGLDASNGFRDSSMPLYVHKLREVLVVEAVALASAQYQQPLSDIVQRPASATGGVAVNQPPRTLAANASAFRIRWT